MKPKRTMAALAATAALMWGSAHAAPEVPPDATMEIPVIILEMQPGPAGSEHEQIIMSMLLLQLLMGLEAQGETPELQPQAPLAPTTGRSI